MRRPRLASAVVSLAAGLLAAGAPVLVASAADRPPRLATTATPAAAAAAPTTYSPDHAIFKGLGFDVCDAPSTATLRSWLSSPYRAVNIYFGGDQRACKTQAELNPQWVSTVVSNGWNLIPTYVGLQPPCTTSAKDTFTADNARTEGRAAAADAVLGLQSLGLGPGNIVYDDFEIYDATRAKCVAAAVDFVEAWTNRLHALGYRAGMYAVANYKDPNTGVLYERGLEPIATKADPRPDAIWFNNWHTGAVLSDPSLHGHWKGHRIHQYTGDHVETFNDNALQIDNDILNGDVVGAVTPARDTAPYVYLASPPATSAGLRERSAPTTQEPNVTQVYDYGATLDIACQAVGETIEGSYVWDRLTNGNYVSDINTTTTGGLAFTAGIPKCDRADPVATMNGVGGVTLSRHRTFSWTGQDATTGDAPLSGIATYDVRWRHSGPRTGFGTWHVVRNAPGKQLTLTLQSGHTYCVQVRATDRSNNRSDWSPKVCTARPLDDRNLRIAAGDWTRQTRSAYWMGTATTTVGDGGRLARRDVRASTLGVVATVCPACGSVRVKIGRHVVGTLDLSAGSRRYRAVLVLPGGALRDGTVKLVSLGGGKVQVDGLVVSRVPATGGSSGV